MSGPATHDDSPAAAVPRRWGMILLALAFGAALTGFLRGISERPPVALAPPRPPAPPRDVPQAVRYAELPTADIRPNARWSSTLAALQFDRPGLFDPVIRTEPLKQAALAERASRRAYDGAPPVVPHPISQQDAASCLACHGQGLKVGGLLASPLSHPFYPNCTQCHVEASNPALAAPAAAFANTFAGLERSGPGERAWPGAPPTIPHATWMRDDCRSCHGLLGRPGLRTTHPWQTSCSQCHAPSAPADQLDFLVGGRPAPE